MINIIKEETEIEESLESRLRVICDFCNTTPTIINGSIRTKQRSAEIDTESKSRDDDFEL